MLIELHILQNFSPSCLNRDDLNAPKDCEFGGVRRARISSQCLKRAARWNGDFTSRLENGIGTRTKLLRKELVGRFVAGGRDEAEALKVVEPVVAAIGSGVDEKDGRTAIALYLGHDEIARIAAAIEEHYEELLAASSEEQPPAEAGGAKKAAGKKAKKGSGTNAAKSIAEAIAKQFRPGTKAADIALFGRMIAEATNFNVDAAAQVAHAISTHSVPSEFDFFTAVDDLQPKEDPGAGMMGSQQFSSATFYRYANVHVPQLLENLGGDAELARAAALAYAHSCVTAIPSAKQNSHAAHNPPDFVFAVVRSKGHPLSLANAFAKPVGKGGRHGIVEGSALALAQYWQHVTRAYGSDGVALAHWFAVHPDISGAMADSKEDYTDFVSGNVGGLKDLLGKIEGALEAWSPEPAR